MTYEDKRAALPAMVLKWLQHGPPKKTTGKPPQPRGAIRLKGTPTKQREIVFKKEPCENSHWIDPTLQSEKSFGLNPGRLLMGAVFSTPACLAEYMLENNQKTRNMIFLINDNKYLDFFNGKIRLSILRKDCQVEDSPEIAVGFVDVHHDNDTGKETLKERPNPMDEEELPAPNCQELTDDQFDLYQIIGKRVDSIAKFLVQLYANDCTHIHLLETVTFWQEICYSISGFECRKDGGVFDEIASIYDIKAPTKYRDLNNFLGELISMSKKPLPIPTFKCDEEHEFSEEREFSIDNTSQPPTFTLKFRPLDLKSINAPHSRPAQCRT